MPHNESQAKNAPETEPKLVEESVKPSKLARVKSVAITTGMFVIPVAVTVGATLVGVKTTQMNFETAKLNLEAAKIGRELADAALKS